MNADCNSLKKRLKTAGFSDPLINAVWPSWWSEDAFASPSANAELRFAIARKLGLSPESLFHDDVEFAWKDEARFKNLSNETEEEKSILTSFGISVGRLLGSLMKSDPVRADFEALDLRKSILQDSSYVDLQSLLITCWAIGIPVIHLRIFPLEAKRMHAMAVRIGDRHAILLGKDAMYPAPVAFTLAHEIGHIMRGHIANSTAIVDVGDLLADPEGDSEEIEADQYALSLLLGTSAPKIRTSVDQFNAPQLADAVLREGPKLHIEPGSLALCLAYQRGLWAIANAAMKFIYNEEKPVWKEVNNIAGRQLDTSTLSEDLQEYLASVMGLSNG